MSTERGRIRIRGFDAERVVSRDRLSAWEDDSAEAESAGRREQAWRRFKRNRLALIGLAVIAAMGLLAIFVRPLTIGGMTVQPFSISEYAPGIRVTFQGSDAGLYAPPSLEHPMGTDRNGRDVFTRVLYGGRYSISIGFVVVVISAIFGLIYGAISGYYGGLVDEVMMRIVDVGFAFPGLVLALVIVAMLGGGYWQLVAAFTIPGWLGYARLIRGEVLSVKGNQYVMAARALGATDRSIIFKHVVPNSIAPVIVQASLSVGTVVIGVAALGFLGLGFESGTPEWGTMLEGARNTLIPGPGGDIYWWATVYPGMAIFVFVMAMNMIGDGINDALDARESVTATQGGG